MQLVQVGSPTLEGKTWDVNEARPQTIFGTMSSSLKKVGFLKLIIVILNNFINLPWTRERFVRHIQMGFCHRWLPLVVQQKTVGFHIIHPLCCDRYLEIRNLKPYLLAQNSRFRICYVYNMCVSSMVFSSNIKVYHHFSLTEPHFQGKTWDGFCCFFELLKKRLSKLHPFWNAGIRSSASEWCPTSWLVCFPLPVHLDEKKRCLKMIK